MFVETYFNENRDKGVAVPGLSQDMAKVMETGVVEDLGLELQYNMFDDPGDISGRVSDVFEALEYARSKSLENAKLNASQTLRNQPNTIAGAIDSVTPKGEEA